MPFRPKLVPTLFVVPMLVILLGLGVWQLQRHAWKSDLIEKLQTRAESPAAPLATDVGDLDASALDAIEFQRVRVSGLFLHDKELYLLNRSLNGNPGVHVLTPLQRSDGGVIMVNRGWTPFDKKDPELRMQGQLAGPVTVEGIVRLMRKPNDFMPDNEPDKNTWFYWDAVAMAAAVGVETLPSYYVSASKNPVAGTYPVGHQWRLDIRNNHIEYAITWFSLAIALIVIYVVYHRQQEDSSGE
ncbi:MAG: SURF1 family protein [Rhodospirillaceae bacterium]|nr:SURF1 family protein [Rhodospirillaceae bacterium]MBT5665689.1 SURF1 family protein [Rhodospirillaceae bacterium]